MHLKLLGESRACWRHFVNFWWSGGFSIFNHARACFAPLTCVNISGQRSVPELVFLVLQETLHISLIHFLIVRYSRHWRSSHRLIIYSLIFIFLDAHSWWFRRLANVRANFCLISWCFLDPKSLICMASLECLVHIDWTTDQTFLWLYESNRCCSETIFLGYRADSLRTWYIITLFTWISTIRVSHWLTRSLMNIL